MLVSHFEFQHAFEFALQADLKTVQGTLVRTTLQVIELQYDVLDSHAYAWVIKGYSFPNLPYLHFNLLSIYLICFEFDVKS